MSARLVADKEVGGVNGVTRLTAEITNGVAPYTFYYTSNDAENFTSVGEKFVHNWYTNKEGTFVISLRVVDATGAEATTQLLYTVEGMGWNYFNADVAAPQKVGTTIQLSANYKNAIEDPYNDYVFYANGEKIGSSQDGTVSWTPTAEGTYLLTVDFMYFTGEKFSASMIYEVKNTNSIKIYYRNTSWTQAYVHYKVSNGAWTVAPGEKMKESDRSGYQWMCEINLGEEEQATVCFNNGSGKWDSRNGANYTVGAGEIAVYNSGIHKVD